MQSGRIPLYRGENNVFWHLTSIVIFLWKYGCTFLPCRAQFEWNLSPVIVSVNQWVHVIKAGILAFLENDCFWFFFWSQDRWTANKAHTPQKGTQLSSCCVPVCALRLNEGICICFIHNHTVYLKSVNACPQFSMHRQIVLLWLMAVQFVDSPRRLN